MTLTTMVLPGKGQIDQIIDDRFSVGSYRCYQFLLLISRQINKCLKQEAVQDALVQRAGLITVCDVSVRLRSVSAI
jgi:hypothetical protein